MPPRWHEGAKRIAIRGADRLGPTSPNVVIQIKLNPLLGEPGVSGKICTRDHFAPIKSLSTCSDMREARGTPGRSRVAGLTH